MNNNDVVIIGGGLGGLFTGALLARNGLSVTVLEKNAIPGGGLQTFLRNGVQFDTGMHVMGGWTMGGSIDRITRYLGIRDRLNIVEINSQCMDTVTSLADGMTYSIPSGRDRFIECMAGYFPEERENLGRYVEAIERIADSFNLFNLRPYSHASFDLLPEASIPADELISRHIMNPRLRSLLAYNNGLYGGEAGRTPAYVHALISVLYLKGASRFIGNSRQLADLLIDVICGAGGNVLCGHEVSGIDVDDDRNITSVVCQNGERYSAGKYVWAAHPSELLRVMPAGVFTKAYTRRVSSVKPTCSAFSLFIELKPETFHYIDHTCYIHDDMVEAWNLAAVDENGVPCGFMYMTPPVENQGEYACKLLATALMDYTQVEMWDDTVTGHRPDEYYTWKNKVADGIIDKISRIHPELRHCIKSLYTASPLTIRDYYHSPSGSVYGFSKDSDNLMESQLPIVTKVRNLYLTGQCINLHGMCGVPLTALTTAEAIMYPTQILPCL